VFKAGCLKAADGIWVNKNDLIQYQISGEYEGQEVAAEYCLTHGQPNGFEIKIVINIIRNSIPGVFSCSAYEEDVGEVLSDQLQFKMIKGELSQLKFKKALFEI